MAIRLGFYGAGEAAQPYLAALAQRADVAVAAVCDADRRAAEQVAAGWNARVCPDPAALLAAGVDAVWVCVPPRRQAAVLLEAAGRGVPFFVEPPGAADFGLARACAAAADRRGLVTAVGFPGRYSDVVAEAKEYLGANPIPLALGWWLAPAGAGAGGDTAADLLWSEACRQVDGMIYFCGPVTRVRALSAGAGGESGGLVVQLEFAGGTVGMLTCASFARPAPRVELEMLGEGWSLNLGRDLATLQLDEHDKSTILRCLNQPRADLAAAFLRAVESGDPAAVAPAYADALHTLAVCEAARLSVAQGRAVAVAEVQGGSEGGEHPGQPQREAEGDAQPHLQRNPPEGAAQ